MPFDTHFDELKQRISLLEQKFLADQLTAEQADPLTYVSDTDLLAAYRMLVHAEIEDYFERKARVVLDGILLNVSKANPYKPDLLIYTLANHFNIHIPHDGPYDNEACKKAVLEIIECAKEFLVKNNGIKTSTFVTLCLICGKSIDSVDSFLCSALSSFGESRGDVAHKSTSRVRTILAPSAEKKAVNDIVKALAGYFHPNCPIT